MYHKQTYAGNTPEFWESNWDSEHFGRAVQFCVIDPLRPLFEKYSRPGALMLEGDGGMGHYVAYYASRGWRVVGLAFDQQTFQKSLLISEDNSVPVAGLGLN